MHYLFLPIAIKNPYNSEPPEFKETILAIISVTIASRSPVLSATLGLYASLESKLAGCEPLRTHVVRVPYSFDYTGRLDDMIYSYIVATMPFFKDAILKSIETTSSSN